MQDSKLFMLLKSIDKKFHSKLINFLKSPYFNKSEKILELIKYILNYVPNYEAKQLKKEAIFKAMFPKEKFEDVKLRRLMSKALKLVEQFVLQIQMEEDELIQHQLLSKYHSKYELDYFFQAKIKSWESLNKKQVEDVFFFENYLIAKTKAEYYNRLLIKELYKNTKKSIDREIIGTIESLQDFYVFQMLSLNCFLQQLSASLNQEIDLELFERFMNFITEEDIKRHPILELSYLSLLLLQNGEEEKYYLELKQAVHRFQANEYEKHILINIYKILEIYVIRKTNKGHFDYYKELIELYKYEIEQELVFKDGKFFPLKFRNIVVIGLRVEEYEWVEYFINTYQQSLAEDQLPDLPCYCLGLLYLKQKKYEKIEEELLKTQDCNDVLLMFDIKCLQIMMYYETDEIDLLDSMMNAFRVLVFRDKFLSEGKKQANQNFINMLFRLVRLQPNDDAKLEKMEEELKSPKLFCNREWLLEKVEALSYKRIK